MVQLKQKVTLKRKQEVEKTQTKTKSKLWLWVFLSLVVILTIVFAIKRLTSDNGENKIVAEKIEIANTKSNEIIAYVQNSNVNFEVAKTKVVEAQKAVDEAKANAKTDSEKQAVTVAQAKVDEARRTVEQEKASAEAQTPATDEPATPVNEEPVANEQPATTSAVPAKPTQPTAEKSETTPAKKEQPTAAKPAESATPAPTLPQGTLEEKAKRVIRGDFGNGADRIKALGSEYNAIQSKVNDMYRKGEVK